MTMVMREDLQNEYRWAMRYFPAAVSIVSCDAGGEWAGTTVTAATSLSVDPPALLVCINRASSFFPRIMQAEEFYLNLLQPGHETIAAEFAGRTPQGQARFAHGNWVADDGGPPRLTDARINILCHRARSVDHGTHTILIGEVRRVLIQGSHASLYHDGVYGRFVGSDEFERIRV